LPRFGGGDWNDGMNRVGREGRGESVWMGFFLHAVLGDFLPTVERRGDRARVERYRAHREALRAALEAHGWDGDWYRRGYYDDGAPLGSGASDECRIDALAQAWSVLSGVAPPERADRALDAVERELVMEREGLVRLLAPPFRDTPQDPGYIKGYVAGVRENGGQYTHAALWFVRALAERGRRDRAARLLAMLSPVSHAATPEGVARYGVEPYVVAADVYGAPPHVGRGGWTWYTGSAGWMFRVALESVLGFTVWENRELRLRPRIPDAWPGFQLEYRAPGSGTRFTLVVSNPDRHAANVVAATLDGRTATIENGAAIVPMRHDGRSHRVEVRLG
jgi:cyclic beta-1,2-glucan synthetase